MLRSRSNRKQFPSESTDERHGHSRSSAGLSDYHGYPSPKPVTSPLAVTIGCDDDIESSGHYGSPSSSAVLRKSPSYGSNGVGGGGGAASAAATANHGRQGSGGGLVSWEVIAKVFPALAATGPPRRCRRRRGTSSIPIPVLGSVWAAPSARVQGNYNNAVVEVNKRKSSFSSYRLLPYPS